MVILLALLLFAVFAASMLYANASFMRYRELLPISDAVGFISAISASFRSMHVSGDSNVSDECLTYLWRSKIAALVSVGALIAMLALMVAVRASGLFEH